MDGWMAGWMDGFSSFVGGNGYLPQISSNSVQYLSEAHTHVYFGGRPHEAKQRCRYCHGTDIRTTGHSGNIIASAVHSLRRHKT